MNFDIPTLFFDETEKPLDRMVTDGGYARIFRTVALVGDSLSSGEFESRQENGASGYHDMYDYSWGNFMARTTGAKVYTFSAGGMSAKQYVQSWAQEKGYWDPSLRAQAYFIALGCNEYCQGIPFGSPEQDVNLTDWRDNNTDTIWGSYCQIIQRYREIQPRAKFFLITMPQTAEGGSYSVEFISAHRDMIYKIAALFPNCYVIDLTSYFPVQDRAYRNLFYMRGHLNPMGYVLTADAILSYVDYIVRHNMKDFFEVGFIGTDLHGLPPEETK